VFHWGRGPHSGLHYRNKSNSWFVKKGENMNETEKNLLTESRARLIVALREFCKAESNTEPCLNLWNCDECAIHRRIEDLKFEVMHDP